MAKGKGFWARFIARFIRDRKTNPAVKATANGSSPAKKLAARLKSTQDVELTCDDVFALLDEYTELALAGEDIASLMPLAKHHLDMCPDCREEYDALQRILRAGSESS